MKHPPTIKDAKIIVVHFVPAPGNWQAPPDKRLARLLKCALRAFGLRCLLCREQPQEHKQP